jgi:glutamate-1-semialdehyde 2,1-aminomutase
MAAGIATLTILRQGDLYPKLEKMGNTLFSGLEALARDAGIQVVVNHIGSMGSLFFTERPVSDFVTASASDAGRFKRYYRAMREQGIYLAPSPFEAGFISAAHTEEMIDKTLDAAVNAFKEMLQ